MFETWESPRASRAQIARGHEMFTHALDQFDKSFPRMRGNAHIRITAQPEIAPE